MRTVLYFFLFTAIPILSQPVFETDKGQAQFIGTLYPSDKPFIYEFMIYNRGDYDLEIYSMKSDCGCTNTFTADSIIAPGDSSLVRFAIKTKRFAYGPNSTVINFFTNDPEMSDIDITLNYDYQQMTSASLLGIAYGLLEIGQERKVEFDILNHSLYPLAITKLEYTDTRIQYDFSVGDTIFPMSTKKVAFSYNTRKEGRIDDEFKIYFDNPLADPIVMAVDGMVVKEKETLKR